MLAPMLVQMERQIDREIAADNKANGVTFGTQTGNEAHPNNVATGTESNNLLFDTDSDDEDESNEPFLMYGPQPQIITNDLKSLDEMVGLFTYFNCLFHRLCCLEHFVFVLILLLYGSSAASSIALIDYIGETQ